MPNYDALLLVSFGGPERREDVMPFLENVLRGRNVPRERMLEVAEHYYQFGGVSPINAQNRALLAALDAEFKSADIPLTLYWGNRNWHPLLPDTLRQMKADGIQRAIAFVTSAFSSYSSCRQYLENISDAQAAVGAPPPLVEKLRPFFNHPGFIETMVERTQAAVDQIPLDRRQQAHLLFTAHSIPKVMADHCEYERQLREAAGLVASRVGRTDWQLVYQSRSGPPNQPWLGPDIGEALEQIASGGQAKDVVVVPIGFLSDHLEILYDLDEQARRQALELGLNFIRAQTAGTHPRLVQMIRELVEERMNESSPRQAVGSLGPLPDVCPADCCQYPTPQRRPETTSKPA